MMRKKFKRNDVKEKIQFTFLCSGHRKLNWIFPFRPLLFLRKGSQNAGFCAHNFFVPFWLKLCSNPLIKVKMNDGLEKRNGQNRKEILLSFLWRQCNSSLRKCPECRILHHLPQSFWGPWAAPRPPAEKIFGSLRSPNTIASLKSNP